MPASSTPAGPPPGGIRRLPESLISKIAAGEVVERPSSIVKELLENALDAGARRIDIAVEEGGRRRISVRDDGEGMGEEDAALAFEPHATSKLSGFDDLEAISTYGFRGEALSSIASVAHVELVTAREDGAGFRLVSDHGRELLREPVPAPRGTTLVVRDLFSQVPVRRRFLKTASAEMRRCLEVVQAYALALPTVGFTFTSEEKVLLEASPCEDDEEGRLERIAQVFGADLASRLVPLTRRPEVSGFVGRPSTARGRRIFVFVNRRLVRDRGVLAAFYRTVRDEWSSERFPALFLFLDLPPEEVDVNVHPQKAEIRFRDQRVVGRVVNSLRPALAAGLDGGDAPLREVEQLPATGLAWQGRGAPGQVAEPGVGGSDAGMPRDGEFRSGQSLLEPDRIRGFVPAAPPPTSPLSRGTEGRPLRLLGQYKGSLLLLEGEDGLYLVDQHAAHERVLYERFRRASLEGGISSQRLLAPRWLEVSGSEAQVLAELAPALETLGFEIATLSGDSVGMTSIPSFFTEDEAERTLLDLAADHGDSEDSGEEGVEGVRRRVLGAMAADSACRSAVKIHRRLNQEQMEQLVESLFRAEQPHTCPHGRPTLLRMGDSELERRFGRR